MRTLSLGQSIRNHHQYYNIMDAAMNRPRPDCPVCGLEILGYPVSGECCVRLPLPTEPQIVQPL